MDDTILGGLPGDLISGSVGDDTLFGGFDTEWSGWPYPDTVLSSADMEAGDVDAHGFIQMVAGSGVKQTVLPSDDIRVFIASDLFHGEWTVQAGGAGDGLETLALCRRVTAAGDAER